MNYDAEIMSRKWEIAARYARGSLAAFTRAMWSVIEPHTLYKHNWHIDAISDFMEAVSKFQIKKGVIMVPPRCMKSITASVMFPAWVWLNHPHRRFLTSSYASSLSVLDAIKMRSIIESPKYQQMFHPDWKLSADQDTKANFQNTKKGQRISTSVSGIATGLGGDHIIGDDLISTQDAASEVIRKEAVDHWLKTLATRGNDPDKHSRTLIMQRLHEKDPAGEWIREDKSVEYLRLPAEYDPKIISFVSIPFKDPRTEEKQLLWPEHFKKENVEDLKQSLGGLASHAQLQQDPRAAEGGTFNRKWWKFYKEKPEDIYEIAQFWDCAEEDGVKNDYSTCATWGRSPTGFFLLDIWRMKVKAPALEMAVKNNYAKFAPLGCNAVIIEKKSNGTATLQNLLASTTLPLIPFVPTVNKVIRASAATPTVEAGNCYLPEGQAWVEDFISEHEKFPLGEHDDQVDTTSMMREYMGTRNISEPRVRFL